ncbi:MAG: transaldolase [Gammaproteobacteria bacterium]
MIDCYLANLKIFLDGAELQQIRNLSDSPLISGFTTNPSLIKKSGIKDYEDFARASLALLDRQNKSISFEVLADDFKNMENQARAIASWGENVYVKVPISNSKGEFSGPLIHRLSKEKIPLNITAVMTLEQVNRVLDYLVPVNKTIISVFAGRIADTGIDPIPMMRSALEIIQSHKNIELLWASSRELLNVTQASEIGCHIITLSHEMIKKFHLFGKNLEEYSVETVATFYKDAQEEGYTIKSLETEWV